MKKNTCHLLLMEIRNVIVGQMQIYSYNDSKSKLNKIKVNALCKLWLL